MYDGSCCRMWRAGRVLSWRLTGRLCSSKPSSTSPPAGSSLRPQAEKNRRRTERQRAILASQHRVSSPIHFYLCVMLYVEFQHSSPDTHLTERLIHMRIACSSNTCICDCYCCFQTAEEDGVKWSEKQRIDYTAQTAPGMKKGD